MSLFFFGRPLKRFSSSFKTGVDSAGKSAKINHRLNVSLKISYAFADDAIAISHKPSDLSKLGKDSITEIGLCLEVENKGNTDVTVCEVGLIGRFDRPRLALHEPLLHDSGPWPRSLAPGSSVIAHLNSQLRSLPVLKSFKKAYVRTSDDQIFYGLGGRALKFFIKQL